MMRVSRRNFTTTVAAVLMLSQVGCATFATSKTAGSNGAEKKTLLQRMPWAKDKNEAPVPYPNPVKIASTWTPDTLVQTGHTPTRGFGGRLFFYDEKSRPVPVEGTLVVHGVDEGAESPQDGVKRFEFTPEQFTRHFSQTDLGASYSVWLPWDAIGGEQKRVSIVASFVTTEGKTIQCVPSVIVLPGRSVAPSEADLLSQMAPQYQRHLDALATNTQPPSGLTTTTIVRRQHPVGSKNTEAGASPYSVDTGSMLAGQSKTPSADLKMVRRSGTSLVQPVSAEMPAKETRSLFRR